MSKSIYKEKILEKLRIIHEQERVLYEILREAKCLGHEEPIEVKEEEK